MTKAAALHEFRCYMHDLRLDAKREGYTVNAAECWGVFLTSWEEAGTIDAATAAQWLRAGPR